MFFLVHLTKVVVESLVISFRGLSLEHQKGFPRSA